MLGQRLGWALCRGCESAFVSVHRDFVTSFCASGFVTSYDTKSVDPLSPPSVLQVAREIKSGELIDDAPPHVIHNRHGLRVCASQEFRSVRFQFGRIPNPQFARPRVAASRLLSKFAFRAHLHTASRRGSIPCGVERAGGQSLVISSQQYQH